MAVHSVDEWQGHPWLVLRIRSHHENVVERSLHQKGINVYLPRQRVMRRSRERRTALVVPLFPGYAFVQPRPDQFDMIRCVRGSCGLVLRGGTPAPMPQKQLEALRLLAASGVELEVNAAFTPGQRVEVIAGPFKGIQGELIRLKSQDRLVINAELVGSCVTVEVDSAEIAIL